MTAEIELKYTLSEEQARKLLTVRHLAGYALTPFITKNVTDVYFDTADGRVARSGYALRLRRKGNKSVLQIKSLTPATGAWHERQELQIIADDPLHPERWPDSPEAHFLRRVMDDAPLQPLFTVRQQRHEAQVMDTAGKPFALLSLDQVRWQAEERSESAWELEIELLPDGDEAALRALADALQDLGELQPQAASKYERGMALSRK